MLTYEPVASLSLTGRKAGFAGPLFSSETIGKLQFKPSHLI